jgi:hypothetical protein
MQLSSLSSLRPPRAGPVGAGCRPALESGDALRAWKEAEAIAWEAERCLYAAWYAYRSSGLAVPALLQHHATTTRALARHKLDQAIAASHRAADPPVGGRPSLAGGSNALTLTHDSFHRPE